MKHFLKKFRTFLYRFVVLMILASSCCVPPEKVIGSMQESVVLLHGMGRTSLSMRILGERLEDHDYIVHYFSYDEMNDDIDLIAKKLKVFVKENVTTRRYHFIGHSLGNIIVREGFRSVYPEGLGRMVMLAPPNKPTMLAKIFENNKLYQWRTGECGQKLSDPNYYKTLPIPSVEFGILAGDKSINPFMMMPSDGVVALSNTRLVTAKDWLVLPHSHTFIMNSQDTLDHCVHFLKTGEFLKLQN